MTWCTISAGKRASAGGPCSIYWRRTRRSLPPSTGRPWPGYSIRQSTSDCPGKWLTVSWSDYHERKRQEFIRWLYPPGSPGKLGGCLMLPLEGITIISIEQAVAAPFATRQLADLGARVVKIERPDVADFAGDGKQV